IQCFRMKYSGKFLLLATVISLVSSLPIFDTEHKFTKTDVATSKVDHEIGKQEPQQIMSVPTADKYSQENNIQDEEDAPVLLMDQSELDGNLTEPLARGKRDDGIPLPISGLVFWTIHTIVDLVQRVYT
ncbi:hypothetical protein PMAYCL1PPCAC_19695, partial [Pristionchus mayeri]